MKIFSVFLFIILLSGCAVASLAGTVVSTTVKVIEVPIKVIGKVVSSDEDEDEDKEKEKDKEE